MVLTDMEAACEAILFACGTKVSVKSISQALKCDEKTAKDAVKELLQKYENEKRGIKIIEIDNSFQMCTNENFFENIKRICEVPVKKSLTPTLLETLAVIAYKQPVTKADIESVRGVSAEHAVNKLVEYGLVMEKGRLDVAGKPILFGTTDEFLRHFGFKSVENLPEINDD